MLKDESPAPSTASVDLYKKAFDPAAFFKDSAAAGGQASSGAAAGNSS